MKRKFLYLLIFVVVSFLPKGVWAREWKLLEEVNPGHSFTGGNPPKVVGVKFLRVQYKDEKPYRLYKIVFRRASRDNGNGWFPLLQARTWGELFTSKKVEQDFILLKWLREKNVNALWNEKFPTLRCKINYMIFYDRGEDRGFHSNRRPVRKGEGTVLEPGHRIPHETDPKRLIAEYLVYGLPPGSHRLEVRVWTKCDENHPLVKGKNIIDCLRFNLIPSAEDIVESGGGQYLTKTKAVCMLHVPAEVPYVEGMKIEKARKKIHTHSLIPMDDPEDTEDQSLDGIVRLQDPIAGTLLRKESSVGLTYYKYKPHVAGVPKKAIELTGEWYAPSNPKYIATISISGNSCSYTGTDENYKHTGTLSYDGTVFKGEVKDVTGFCCGNEGYMWLKVVDGDTLEVKSEWWKPESKDIIILKVGWDTLKRDNR